ncbi:MAG TPA: hypothetical protein VHX37_07885 [Acidobacteriaceae bacterium]|jgi:hypothetical protein|nr:hypothetical protein [Acidobacteriaceae bacterium]
MHVHGPHFNPDYQLNALYAAARTEARREAERTRRKLLSAASSLAGEAAEGQDYVVTLRGRGDNEEETGQQDQRGQKREPSPNGTGDDAFSDYA